MVRGEINSSPYVCSLLSNKYLCSLDRLYVFIYGCILEYEKRDEELILMKK